MADQLADSRSRPTYHPQIVVECLHRAAKWWLGLSLVLKFLVVGVGIVAAVRSGFAYYAPFLALALVIVAEFATYHSDAVKGAGQALQRKLDLHDGFGHELPNAELADTLAMCSGWVRRTAAGREPERRYFASTQPPGPRRAVANVAESAWWSKHLAWSMYWRCLYATFGTVLVSLVILVVTLIGVKDQELYPSLARVGTAILTLIPSLGMVKLITGYHGFATKAGQVEEQVKRLGERQVSEITAMKVVFEYHLARAAAPPIPDWIFRSRQHELNQLWDEVRSPKPTTNTESLP
jgi:hypothetical protein